MEVFKPLIKTLIYALDDEESILRWISIAFDEHGIKNYKTFTKKDVMYKEFNEDVQICIVDLNISDADNGIAVMKQIKKMQPLCTCILMSKMASEDDLIDIMNAGCNRFIRKDKANWIEQLMMHVSEAAIENDTRLRRTLQAAARITDTINFFEAYKKNIPNGNVMA